ncbi:AAA family ATPase [Campylobacter lari]|nr:AAA family ATPase [Campylobacter lari]EAK0798766.1 AAA family ATPase [Campylobacter lari]
MIEFLREDIEKFKKYLVDFFHNAYSGVKLSFKDEINNFDFLKKYGFNVALRYGQGVKSKKPYIIFIRMDTKQYKTASYGVYVYCGIEIKNEKIDVCIGDSNKNKVNYIAKNKVDTYNTQFNNKVYDYKNLNNDIDKITNKIIENMQWFAKLPLNEIQDRNALFISNIKEIRSDENKILSKKENQNSPLNQILYGPPGTGKTYHTIDKALEIISKVEKIELPDENNRVDRKKLFNEYVKNGQIVFTTFHQSYGYEEFVEGIKPDINNTLENSQEVNYKIENGIFKELCEKALDNYENSILNTDELNKKIELKEKVENFLNWLLETNEPISKTKGGNFFVVDINDKTVMIYSKGVERFDGNFNLSISIFMELLKHNDEFNNASEMFKKVFDRDYADRTHTYYFNLVKKFKAYEKQSTVKNENKKNNDNSLKPYLIIIDEINRGNVSKIFGELITLIEPSKRIGEKEELRVTLPYSKDEFGVPKNVYIIGTMNTADRSITSLDTALRRRFEFVEMIPNPDILNDNCEGVNLQELLKAINTRIEYLLDREKTIGHAFFIGIDNLEKLKNVFQNKIIPLLQEYFYDDYALINMVLNDNGMLEKKDTNSDYLKNITNFIERDNGIYEFSNSKDWDESTFVKIYENDK